MLVFVVCEHESSTFNKVIVVTVVKVLF